MCGGVLRFARAPKSVAAARATRLATCACRVLYAVLPGGAHVKRDDWDVTRGIILVVRLYRGGAAASREIA